VKENFQEGDELVSINGHNINDTQSFVKVLDKVKQGGSLKFIINREEIQEKEEGQPDQEKVSHAEGQQLTPEPDGAKSILKQNAKQQSNMDKSQTPVAEIIKDELPEEDGQETSSRIYYLIPEQQNEDVTSEEIHREIQRVQFRNWLTDFYQNHFPERSDTVDGILKRFQSGFEKLASDLYREHLAQQSKNNQASEDNARNDAEDSLGTICQFCGKVLKSVPDQIAHWKLCTIVEVGARKKALELLGRTCKHCCKQFPTYQMRDTHLEQCIFAFQAEESHLLRTVQVIQERKDSGNNGGGASSKEIHSKLATEVEEIQFSIDDLLDTEPKDVTGDGQQSLAQSSKGKARQKKKATSEKRKAQQKKYAASEKGRARIKRYNEKRRQQKEQQEKQQQQESAAALQQQRQQQQQLLSKLQQLQKAVQRGMLDAQLRGDAPEYMAAQRNFAMLEKQVLAISQAENTEASDPRIDDDLECANCRRVFRTLAAKMKHLKTCIEVNFYVKKVGNMGLLLVPDNERNQIIVADVQPQAPKAIQENIEPGDCIISVDGEYTKDLENVNDLARSLLFKIPVGKIITIGVQKKPKRVTRNKKLSASNDPNNEERRCEMCNRRFKTRAGRINHSKKCTGVMVSSEEESDKEEEVPHPDHKNMRKFLTLREFMIIEARWQNEQVKKELHQLGIFEDEPEDFKTWEHLEQIVLMEQYLADIEEEDTGAHDLDVVDDLQCDKCLRVLKTKAAKMKHQKTCPGPIQSTDDGSNKKRKLSNHENLVTRSHPPHHRLRHKTMQQIQAIAWDSQNVKLRRLLGRQQQEDPKEYNILVTKVPNMGLTLRADNEHKRIVVEKVDPSAPVELASELHPGYYITRFNEARTAEQKWVDWIVKAIMDGSLLERQVLIGYRIPDDKPDGQRGQEESSPESDGTKSTLKQDAKLARRGQTIAQDMLPIMGELQEETASEEEGQTRSEDEMELQEEISSEEEDQTGSENEMAKANQSPEKVESALEFNI